MSIKDLERRLAALEKAHSPNNPLVVVIEPIDSDGNQAQVQAFSCEQTGDRWERQPDESMPDFITRVEQAAHAMPGKPLSIMLAPEWPEFEGPGW